MLVSISTSLCSSSVPLLSTLRRLIQNLYPHTLAVPLHLHVDQDAPSIRRLCSATPSGSRVLCLCPSCSSGPFAFTCLLLWTCHFPHLFFFGLSLFWSLKTRLYLAPSPSSHCPSLFISAKHPETTSVLMTPTSPVEPSTMSPATW